MTDILFLLSTNSVLWVEAAAHLRPLKEIWRENPNSFY